jgi:starvation-inducible outer membrane lipoprotein
VKYLLILLLAACGPIPVSINRTSQEQSQSNSQEASTAADQQSSHASESRHDSMPIIVVCVQNNSGNSQCATPQQPLSKSIKEIQK